MAIILFCFCIGQAVGETTKRETISPIPELKYEEESVIPTKDISEVEGRAVFGSAEAAVRLARHFGKFGDVKNQVYWLTIAVENGDDEQQLWLARALWRDESDPLNVVRARYWYNRIIKSASPAMSAFAKNELDAKEKYRKEFQPKTPRNDPE
jgi:hypothetical protein